MVGGEADYERHQAARHPVFLEQRRQVHPLRPGSPRRRELQRLRCRCRRCRPCRPGSSAGQKSYGGDRCPRVHLRCPEERSRYHVRRHQRSRQSLARSLQGAHLNGRKDAVAQEHRAHRRLAVRQRRQCAARRAHDRQGRHRDPACRSNRLHPGLLVQRLRDVQSGAL